MSEAEHSALVLSLSSIVLSLSIKRCQWKKDQPRGSTYSVNQQGALILEMSISHKSREEEGICGLIALHVPSPFLSFYFIFYSILITTVDSLQLILSWNKLWLTPQHWLRASPVNSNHYWLLGFFCSGKTSSSHRSLYSAQWKRQEKARTTRQLFFQHHFADDPFKQSWPIFNGAEVLSRGPDEKKHSMTRDFQTNTIRLQHS